MQCGASLVGFLLPCAALAQGPVSLHASYDTYAAGVRVGEVETGFSFGPWTYQMNLGYHTTGMIGFFFRGHQFDLVNGVWHGKQAEPSRFVEEGVWRGEERRAEVDYQQCKPVVRQLVPPNAAEREDVPEAVRADSVDTLSAIAELIHAVEQTGRCEMKVRTYDGRRAVEIEARTVGDEVLAPTSRSSFAGKALRCDFSGRMLAGFKFSENRERDSKPMHGCAWLAPVAAGGPLVPVRLVFETRWLGDATMYLTATGPGSDVKIVHSN